ncbi:membrane protein [Arenicella chitinivorans]|uniref:Membrane protein n=1 Tax=Arenicella chitinivorans TaxID=1329800 RepID=A0A918RLT4_9GAMM|nr:DMT family transporter [Arenicella chitinivorans]GHA03285.1 membrane protein [Arenicella chitinivorans]
MAQQRAMFFGLAAVLCWSTVATAFKLSLQHLTPTQLILVASLTSWLFLLGVLAVQGKFRALFRQSSRHYLNALLFGLLNPALYYCLLFTAYARLPAQEAQAINYSWAIVMSFLAVPILGQKLTRADLFAALICYFGVVIIATRGDVLGMQFEDTFGLVCALLSTLVWALYWILNRRQEQDAILGLCLNFSFALPVLGLYAWWSGELLALFNSVAWQGWAGGIYVGMFETGLAFLFWLQAMKLATNTSRIANLIFISPFVSLVLIAVILKEPILISTLVGLGLILTGLVVQQRYSQ